MDMISATVVTGTVSLTIENPNNFDSAVSPVGTLTLKATATTTLAGGPTVTRKIQCTAARGPLFVNAVAAVSTPDPQGSYGYSSGVHFKEAGATVDSDLFPGGAPNPTPSDYSAVISSVAGIELSSAMIHGFVACVKGQLQYTPSTQIGGFDTPASAQVDQDRVSTSPYQPVFELKLPNGSATAPWLPTGTATIGDSSDITPAVYRANDVELAGTDVLTVNGPVILVVSGDFKIKDTAKIVIAQDLDHPSVHGSLQVLLTGQTSDLSIAALGIQNDTHQAKNLAIFDGAKYPANPPTISMTQPFYGALYAPYSTRPLTIDSDKDFYGSIVGGSVEITQSAKIHYDLELRKPTLSGQPRFSGVEAPFVVSSWQETTP